MSYVSTAQQCELSSLTSFIKDCRRIDVAWTLPKYGFFVFDNIKVLSSAGLTPKDELPALITDLKNGNAIID
ncbi:MAG: hypothetical protein M1812_006612, partial [Candelaria pacifica]